MTRTRWRGALSRRRLAGTVTELWPPLLPPTAAAPSISIVICREITNSRCRGELDAFMGDAPELAVRRPARMPGGMFDIDELIVTACGEAESVYRRRRPAPFAARERRLHPGTCESPGRGARPFRPRLIAGERHLQPAFWWYCQHRSSTAGEPHAVEL